MTDTEYDLIISRLTDTMKTNRRMVENAIMNNWISIIVRNWKEVDTDWCLENLVGEYLCMGYYWYFEKEEDVIMFALRWSHD